MTPAFDDILCISLSQRQDRRRHAHDEFDRVGIKHFRWVDACGAQSEEVTRAFRGGLVADYPPCFRCGREACHCENRRLLPEQVGCWLSHQKAWRQVHGAGLTLICEDDVRFTERLWEGVDFALGQYAVAESLQAQVPVLVRFGRALGKEHGSDRGFRLSPEPSMANPCYAINSAMSEVLLSSSGRVTTTVDIYTHRVMGPTVAAYTLEPPVAYELSWSTGELRSDIRPKRIYIDYMKARLSTLEPGDARHEMIIREIERELARFERMRTFEARDQGGAPLPALVR